MKKLLAGFIAFALLATAPLVADTFFTDNFSNGSTTNGLSIPGGTPTASYTSYDIASSKNSTLCAIAPGDFTLKLNAATTSGWLESQALFTTSPVALTVDNDYIELTIVFTNTGGLLAGGTTSYLWVGLYNSAGSKPVAGGGLAASGLNGTAGSSFATGNCANWQGYVSQVSSNGSSRIYTRPLQNGAGTTSANQDLIGDNVGTGAFNNPRATTLVTAPATSIALTAGSQYTLLLRITLSAANNLTVSNSLFSGAGTGGTMLFSQMTNNVTGATFLTANFDGFAIGAMNKGTSFNPIMDITSVVITGQSTAVTTPPDITSQPVPVSVANGGSCLFSVSATGFGMTYQWHRYGTNLLNAGNISGATSDTLIISPVSGADVASGANGYWVTVSGTGGYSTNSTTNSLTLRTAANLVWSGGGNVWDLATTADWLSGATPTVFNYGDSVTFDDTGIGNATVTLAGNYLSAASVTVNTSFGNDYVFSGSGSFAGLGALIYNGAGHLTMNNPNSYSGGTLISNASAWLVLNNYSALGTGPVTLAGGTMEIVPAGGASLGIKGNVVVADDFTIYYDANSAAYGAVLLGNLSGTTNKTLTLNRNSANTAPSRVRIYGPSTVYNANLNMTDPRIVWACYQSSGSQVYNGVISGSGALIQRDNGMTILNGANTYSGGTTPTTGTIAFGIDSVGTVDSGPIGTGPLFLAPETPNLTGSGTVLAWGGARTIANPIQYPSATNNLTLIIGGTNRLTFSGLCTLNGNDGTGATNRIFQVTNTALTTLSGVVSDGGLVCGLIKTGPGTLALDNAETYTGPTTISNGTLQVNGQLAAASDVTVWTNGILGGIGPIGGSVTVNAGGAIAPGASIGTLNIGGNLSLAGNLSIEVNRSASPTSDKTVVTGTLNNTGTGTVTVTNLGPALAPGDSFALFNKAVGNGGALSVSGANATWTNKLAIDGTIAVLSVMATTPTNISYSLSGTSLTLNWPANYLGWILQSNSVGVTTTNWFALTNSQNATQFVITLDPAKPSVFYRLLRP